MTFTAIKSASRSNLPFIQFRNSLLQNWVSQRFSILCNNRGLLDCSEAMTMKQVLLIVLKIAL